MVMRVLSSKDEKKRRDSWSLKKEVSGYKNEERTRKQMWEAEGWRAEMIKLGGKMPTLTHQIHLYSENINI